MRLFLFFILNLFFLAPFTPCRAETYFAHVVGVSDGDSITVLHADAQIRIRLWGIDCPEKGQEFGYKAKQRTSQLLYGKEVEVRPETIDNYGRTVAHVTVAGLGDVNQKLVAEGLCWWYEKYAPKDLVLKNLQQLAKQQKLGIWSRSDSEPPWSFRALKRELTLRTD